MTSPKSRLGPGGYSLPAYTTNLIQTAVDTVETPEVRNKVTGFIWDVAEIVNIGEVLVKLLGLIKFGDESISVANAGSIRPDTVGVQGFWEFENGSNLGEDSSANGNDLITTGGTFSQSTDSPNGSHSLDIVPIGVTTVPTYLSIAHASQIGLSITGEITISFWVKPRVFYTGFYYQLISKNFFPGGYGVAIWGISSTQAEIIFSPSNITGGTVLYSTQKLNLNQWYHIVCTFKDSEAISRIYIDGVLDSTKSIGTGLLTNTYPFFMINTSGIGYYRANVIMDNAFVMNVALTDSEVSLIYTEGILRLLSMTRPFTETIQIASTYLRNSFAYIMETVWVQPYFSPQLGFFKTVGETISILTDLQKFFATIVYQFMDEVIYPLEEFIYQNYLYQALSEQVQIVISSETYLGFVKIKDEVVDILTSSQARIFIRQVIPELVHIEEIRIRAATWKRFFDEEVSVITNPNLRLNLRLISNSLVMIDELHQAIPGAFQRVAEVVSLADVSFFLKGLKMGVDEQVHIISELSRGFRIKTLTTEVLWVSSDILRTVSYRRQFNEFIRLGEQSPYTAKQLGRIIENTIQLNEDLFSSVGVQRILSDLITVTQTEWLVVGFTRGVGETVRVSESILTKVHLLLLVSEYIRVEELFQGSQALKRVTEEFIRVQEAKEQAWQFYLAISEGVTIRESLVSSYNLFQVLLESITVEELAETLRGLSLSVLESVTISELITFYTAIIEVLVERVEIGTDLIRTSHLTRFLSDTIQILTHTNLSLNLGKVVNNAITVTEDLIKLLSLMRQTSETVTVREDTWINLALYTLSNLGQRGVKVLSPEKSVVLYLAQRGVKLLTKKRGTEIE